MISSQEQNTWLNTDVPKVPRTEVTYTCKFPRETLAKQDHQMLSNLVRSRHGCLHVSGRRLQVCLSAARWDWTDFEQPPKRERRILTVLPVLQCQSQQSSCVQCFGRQPTGDADAKRQQFGLVLAPSQIGSSVCRASVKDQKCSATNSYKRAIVEVS